MRGVLLGLAVLSMVPSSFATPVDWQFLQPSSTTSKACDVNQEVIWVWSPRQQRASIEKLLARWQAHPLAPFVACLQPRQYERQADLQCAIQGEREHQRCQLPLLPREVTQRHVVFTEVKTASTSSLQMVLPTSASVALFAHEVAHWLGFADEYPMSPSLAEPFCTGRYAHPSLNVVTTHAQVLSATELKQLWQRLPWRHAVTSWRLLGQEQSDGTWRLGSTETQAVGLFASRTCAAIDGVYSWKPVARMTAMEYHDVNYWPKVYLESVRGLQRSRSLRNHDDWTE